MIHKKLIIKLIKHLTGVEFVYGFYICFDFMNNVYVVCTYTEYRMLQDCKLSIYRKSLCSRYAEDARVDIALFLDILGWLSLPASYKHFNILEFTLSLTFRVTQELLLTSGMPYIKLSGCAQLYPFSGNP